MDARQLRELIVRPTLLHIGLWSAAAEELVLGTAAQESQLHFIKQLGGGPAIGLYQMEPATHDDLWATYLIRHPDLAARVRGFSLAPSAPVIGAEQLAGNLYYATALCRVCYRRVSAALPQAADIESLAAYWKVHYNTYLGAGSVGDFVAHYRALIAPKTAIKSA